MLTINLSTWKILATNSAARNTANFNYFFEEKLIKGGSKNQVRLILPAGEFNFDLLEIGRPEILLDGLEFKGAGIGKTIIKFSFNEHTGLLTQYLSNFTISDISIDGTQAKFEGGFWVRGNCTNGRVERLEIYNAHDVSCVISGPNTSYITVRDCQVYNQRNFDGNSKAMFLAGDAAQYVTFDNCHSFSKSKNGESFSVADHFDTDNALYVNYFNCIANGEGSRGGVGFWNEGEGEGLKSVSSYYGCTAYKTYGGLATTENAVAKAYGMNFVQCSQFGWTVWSKGNYPYGLLTLTGGFFKNCGSDLQNRKYGGIHIEGNTIINNCQFEDTPENCFNISFYRFSDFLPLDTYAQISECTFDKGVVVDCPYLNDGPAVKNISIENCLFKENAFFMAQGNPAKYIIKIRGNTFRELGLKLSNVRNIRIKENVFISTNQQLKPIEVIGSPSGTIEDNLFTGYASGIFVKEAEAGKHNLQVLYNDFE